MLDKKAYRILEIMLSMTEEGESAVIEKSEIIVEYGEVIDITELDTIVELLALNDMIGILYTDNSVYCITPKPKGILTCDTMKIKREDEKLKRVEAEAKGEVIDEEEKDPAQIAAEILDRQARKNVPVVTTARVNYLKMAIISGISAFIGSLMAALVAYYILF
ncbi:MAG: hypothetical protein WCR54_07300 [Clostridia bacterium]